PPPPGEDCSGPPNSEMSAPAAKIRSPPVTTTAPGGSSVRATATASSCASNPLDKGLTLGFSSRTPATPSLRRSTCTSASSADMGGTLRVAEEPVGGRPRGEVTRRHRVGQLRRLRAGGHGPGPLQQLGCDQAGEPPPPPPGGAAGAPPPRR